MSRPDPVFLATAIRNRSPRRRHPAVAPRIRIPRRQERHHRPRHRSRSRVRADVPRGHRRAVSRPRRARRGIEQRPRRSAQPRRIAGCSTRSTARRTTRTACRSSAASLALEIDGRAEAAAVYDPTRAELFTAERGEGAYLNGTRLRVSTADRLIDSLLVTGFPYDVHQQSGRPGRHVRGVPGPGARGAPARLGGARPLLRRRRTVRRLLGAAPQAVGRGGGSADRDRGGRARSRAWTASPFDPVAAHLVASNGSRARRDARCHPRVPRRACSAADGLTSGDVTSRPRRPARSRAHRVSPGLRQLFQLDSWHRWCNGRLMHKRLIPVLLFACTVIALAPATASAQQTFNFSLGVFTPRGEDARVAGDVLNANRTFLFFDVKDFKSASVGGEWLVPLNEFFEAGAGIGFSRRTVPTVYTDFTDVDGTEIEQELRLRLVPISFTVRALPLGQSQPVPAVLRRRAGGDQLALRGVRRFHRLQQQPGNLPRVVRRQRHRNRARGARRHPLRRADADSAAAKSAITRANADLTQRLRRQQDRSWRLDLQLHARGAVRATESDRITRVDTEPRRRRRRSRSMPAAKATSSRSRRARTSPPSDCSSTIIQPACAAGRSSSASSQMARCLRG